MDADLYIISVTSPNGSIWNAGPYEFPEAWDTAEVIRHRNPSLNVLLCVLAGDWEEMMDTLYEDLLEDE